MTEKTGIADEPTTGHWMVDPEGFIRRMDGAEVDFYETERKRARAARIHDALHEVMMHEPPAQHEMAPPYLRRLVDRATFKIAQMMGRV